MPELQAQRTLVKSLPELWAELSDPAALARHLGEFGEIRITRSVPEQTVAWEGERASGTVELTASGWGTKVTLRARLAESHSVAPPAEPAEQEQVSSQVTRPAEPFEVINSLARDPLPRVADSFVPPDAEPLVHADAEPLEHVDAEPLVHADAEPLEHVDAEPFDPDTALPGRADAPLDSPALSEPTPAAEPAPEPGPAAEAVADRVWAGAAPPNEIGPAEDVSEDWFSDASEFGPDAGGPVTPAARAGRRSGFFHRFFGRRSTALEVHDVPEFRPGAMPARSTVDIPAAAEPDGPAPSHERELLGYADEPDVVGFVDEPEVEAGMPEAGIAAAEPTAAPVTLDHPEPAIDAPDLAAPDPDPGPAMVAPQAEATPEPEAEPEAEAEPEPKAEPAPEPEPEPEPAMMSPEPEPEPEPATPTPTPTPDDTAAEPEVDAEWAEAVLTGVLNELGTARHRPFSRG